MIYLTVKEAALLIISVSSLTLMIYNLVRNRKVRFKKCIFIDAD